MRRLPPLCALFAAGCLADDEPHPLAPAGLLAVANLEGHEVLLFDPATGAAVAPLVSGDSLPEGVAPEGFEPAGVASAGGELIVANFRSGEVLAFDARDGRWLRNVHENGSPTLPRLEEPCAIRPWNGGLVVLGNDSRNLLVLDAQGRVTAELGGPGASAALRAAHGFAIAPDGRAFVATSPSERSLGLVQVWDLHTGERLDHFAPYGEIEEGTDAALGPDGLLWVVDWFGDQIVRFDPDSGARIDVIASSSDGVDRPIALVFDPSGEPWLLDRRGVVRLSGGETVVEAGANGFDWARGVAFVGG